MNGLAIARSEPRDARNADLLRSFLVICPVSQHARGVSHGSKAYGDRRGSR